MKACVATMHTPWSYQELADLTNPNKEKYCIKNGYDFGQSFLIFITKKLSTASKAFGATTTR